VQPSNRTVSHLENRLLNIPDDTPEQRAEKTDLRFRLARVYLSERDYSHALGPFARASRASPPKNAEAQKMLRVCEAALRAAEARQPPTTPPATAR
jgi:cytochrome c-type biogenesis protein CcmH/NrfG